MSEELEDSKRLQRDELDISTPSPPSPTPHPPIFQRRGLGGTCLDFGSFGG